MFVNYHLNIGIDEIILFFDDPLDTAIKEFSQYQNVRIVACTNDYWIKKLEHIPEVIGEKQITNVNAGVQIAVDKGCDWIVHIDSDELIDPVTNIKHFLANSRADALRFRLLEAMTEKHDCDHIFATTIFKKPSSEKRLKIAKLFGCSHIFFENEYFRGHSASKMALRVSPKIRIYGVHGPKEYDKNTTVMENTNTVRLLHFDCVGFDNWNTKWKRRTDGTCNSQTMRPNRLRQRQEHIQAEKTGCRSLLKLYKRLHMVSAYEKSILFMLGMLTRVRLNKSLFEKS